MWNKPLGVDAQSDEGAEAISPAPAEPDVDNCASPVNNSREKRVGSAGSACLQPRNNFDMR